MKPGSVIQWDKFELKNGPGPDKTRWFIFLGCNGVFSCPAYLFAVTPTSRFEHYESPSGDRCNNKVVRFEPHPASPFPISCIVDIEYGFYQNIPTSYYTDSKENITIHDQVEKGKMKELWRIIDMSSKISKIVRRDIKASLESAGYKL